MSAATTTWRLPARYSAAQIVAAVRHAQDPSHSGDRYATPAGETFTAEGFCRWFRERLLEKINRNEAPRGRKAEAAWFWETFRAARKLNTPRLVVRERELPLWLRGRMAHRVTTED